MAQRRMISLEVVDTDAFLDMPQSSQLLYFHLSVRADDDGFVANPKKIARTLGANLDDMKVLITKKFIIAFEDGVCVIKHWRINNFIRKDLYKETKYLNLKQTLFIRPNGAYTLTDDGNAVPIPQGHFQLESVNDTLTKRQLSIGKDREDINTAPKTAGFKEKYLNQLKEKSKTSKIFTSKQLLASEVSEWSRGKLNFKQMCGIIRNKGEQFVRQSWMEIKQEKADDPVALFMWKLGKAKIDLVEK